MCFIVIILNPFMHTNETCQTKFEFSGLMSNTSYNIAVRAINRAGIGLASNIIVTTLTDDQEGKKCLLFLYMQYK